MKRARERASERGRCGFLSRFSSLEFSVCCALRSRVRPANEPLVDVAILAPRHAYPKSSPRARRPLCPARLLDSLDIAGKKKALLLSGFFFPSFLLFRLGSLDRRAWTERGDLSRACADNRGGTGRGAAHKGGGANLCAFWERGNKLPVFLPGSVSLPPSAGASTRTTSPVALRRQWWPHSKLPPPPRTRVFAAAESRPFLPFERGFLGFETRLFTRRPCLLLRGGGGNARRPARGSRHDERDRERESESERRNNQVVLAACGRREPTRRVSSSPARPAPTTPAQSSAPPIRPRSLA